VKAKFGIRLRERCALRHCQSWCYCDSKHRPARSWWPGETGCLTLVWAVLDRASAGWRGLAMTANGLRLLQDLRRSLLEPVGAETLSPCATWEY
jgi:hypothetical protein